MADCYQYLGNEERFRANAYEAAAKMIANMSEPIDKYNHRFKELDELKSIGKSIAEKIIEYLDTGKIKAFDLLKRKVPFDLLELMEVQGIGPATVRLLHDELKVETRAALIEKIKSGYLLQVKGIKAERYKIISGALQLNSTGKRIPLAVAQKIAEELMVKIKKIKGVELATIAGSVRREKTTIGDIDIVIVADRKSHQSIIRNFLKFPMVKRVLAKGSTKASVWIDNNFQVDLRVVEESEYAAALLYFTGPKEHTILLRTLAKKRGLKLNEYGLFDSNTGKKIITQTEADIYKLLNIPFIQPGKRVGKIE